MTTPRPHAPRSLPARHPPNGAWPAADHALAGIELMRFGCAFAVLMTHYSAFSLYGIYDESIFAAARPTMPLYAILFPFYEFGPWAVQMFWLISGFIFYRQYADVIGKITLREFMIRRFSRLYPLHFTTLVLVALTQ